MTTRAERFREHLGRLAGHVVRGYRKVIGPRPRQVPNRRPNQQRAPPYQPVPNRRPPPYQPVPNRRPPPYQPVQTRSLSSKKAQNLARVQQLINAGVLKPRRRHQVELGTSLNSIMNTKMGNWKFRLGMNSRNLRNRYGNLGNIQVLKRIRNNARVAQNNKNQKRKMNNARRYIQTLSVNNLTKLLTPNQLKAFSVHVRTEKIGANRFKHLNNQYRTYQEYNNERAGRYPLNLIGKLSDNSLSKLRALGLEPSSASIRSRLGAPSNRYGNPRDHAKMNAIINGLYREHLKNKNENAQKHAQKLSNLRKRINTNGRLNPRAKEIARYLHGLSTTVVKGINKTTLNSAKAKKKSTSGNPEIPNANGNSLYNIYLQEALNLNKKLTLNERRKTLVGSLLLRSTPRPPGQGSTPGNGKLYKAFNSFTSSFYSP